MSKKKTKVLGRRKISDEKHVEIIPAASVESSFTSQWSRLNLQNKFLAFGLIAFLTVGAFGAALKYLEDSAKRDAAIRNSSNNEPNLLSQLNPFTANPSPTPSPQLAKEYIYAGSRLLAVEDANANAAPPADLAVWRPSTSFWYVLGGVGSQQVYVQWGTNGDIPVQGDYDGDGKTDFSVFRPSEGKWYVQRSSDGGLNVYTFGLSGDKLVQADYDGDGKTDIAVYRDGTWYVLRSSDSGFTTQQFGLSSDVPAAADYDGDGKADFGVWRAAAPATFYVLKSSNGQLQSGQLGQVGDVPVSADYDGDGRADYAVRSGANWNFLYSVNNQTQTIPWELSTDKAVHNDYDGDGKVDVAVWRESSGTWYIRNSSTGQLRQAQWGMSGDIPVPAFYRR